jgi:hypothetical protein
VRSEAGQLIVEEATAQDEPGLRRLLADNPMEGAIRVSLEREPNAFFAAAVEGERHRTIVARDPTSGRIVGMGSRAVWNAFVNGEPRRLGYLSQLRLDRSFRGRPSLLAAGYRLIGSFRQPDEEPFDVTSILADNRVARRLLEAGLRGFPAYRPVEPFTTLILAAGRPRRPTGVERGSVETMPEIAACLARNRRRYQLAPTFSTKDLLSPERSRGLAPESFFLVTDRGRVRGCLALWDQGSFKQAVVRGYAPGLARLRPWINRLAPLLRTPRLPAPGEPLPHAFLAHVAVDDDDLATFRTLVEAAFCEACARRYAYVAIGLASRHPWVDWLERRFKVREVQSVLYAVEWDRQAGAAARLDGRMAHVEAAVL